MDSPGCSYNYTNRTLVKRLALLLLSALALRLVLFLAVQAFNPGGFFTSDSCEYWQLAENLAHHTAFSRDPTPPLSPEHERTPLYPLFLAAFRLWGLDVGWIIPAQALLSTLTVGLTVALVQQLWGRWKAGLAAGWLLALDIPSIVYANLLLTETLFTFLLILALYIIARAVRRRGATAELWAAGFVLGLATLCRPLGVFLPLALLPVIIYGRGNRQGAGGTLSTLMKAAKKTTALLLPYSLVVSIWVVRNWLAFGTPFLSTIVYHNLFNYRAGGVYAVEHGLPLQEASRVLQRQALEAFSGDPTQSPVDFREFQGRMALSVILSHPHIYIRNAALSAASMLFKPLRSTIDLQLGLANRGSNLGLWGNQKGLPFLTRLIQNTSPLTIALVVVQLGMLLAMWPAFGWGMWVLWWEGRRWAVWLLMLPILYLVVVSAGPEAYARFRVPVMPMVATGAGVGISRCLHLLQHSRWRTLRWQ